jgi:hypothetical protein
VWPSGVVTTDLEVLTVEGEEGPGAAALAGTEEESEDSEEEESLAGGGMLREVRRKVQENECQEMVRIGFGLVQERRESDGSRKGRTRPCPQGWRGGARQRRTG